MYIVVALPVAAGILMIASPEWRLRSRLTPPPGRQGRITFIHDEITIVAGVRGAGATEDAVPNALRRLHVDACTDGGLGRNWVRPVRTSCARGLCRAPDDTAK